MKARNGAAVCSQLSSLAFNPVKPCLRGSGRVAVAGGWLHFGSKLLKATKNTSEMVAGWFLPGDDVTLVQSC